MSGGGSTVTYHSLRFSLRSNDTTLSPGGSRGSAALPYGVRPPFIALAQQLEAYARELLGPSELRVVAGYHESHLALHLRVLELGRKVGKVAALHAFVHLRKLDADRRLAVAQRLVRGLERRAVNSDGDGTPSLPPHPMAGPPFHRRPPPPREGRAPSRPYGKPPSWRRTGTRERPPRLITEMPRADMDLVNMVKINSR